MSTSIVRSRHTNNVSLGSRFDWFVIEQGHATDDIYIKLNPVVKARVHDPYAAQTLADFYTQKAAIQDLNFTYIAMSYCDTCDFLDSVDWRLRSFEDTFNLGRLKYTIRFSNSKEITVTAYNERQAIERAQYRLESTGVTNADTIDSAKVIFTADCD